MKDLITILKDARKHLMTGVSYMIPFVVTGGVFLAVAMIFGDGGVPETGALGKIGQLGSAGLALMVPILSGYIGFSIADRPALAPAIIGGYLANEIGAGFIGGIISGLLAGIVAYYLKQLKVPNVLRSVMPILIIPLVGSFIVSGFMLFIIGEPIALLMAGLENMLEAMGTENLVLIGFVLGAMHAFDMGGPIAKVAYGFAVGMLSSIDPATGMPLQSSMILMATVGVSTPIPPMVVGLSTLLFKKKFTSEEREAGKAALIMTLPGITESAIPFAANDPLRVIPILTLSGGLGGAIVAFFKVTNPVPWGGLIVGPATNNVLIFVGAIIFSGLVGAVAMGLLKKEVTKEELEKNSEEVDFDIEII